MKFSRFLISEHFFKKRCFYYFGLRCCGFENSIIPTRIREFSAIPFLYGLTFAKLMDITLVQTRKARATRNCALYFKFVVRLDLNHSKLKLNLFITSKGVPRTITKYKKKHIKPLSHHIALPRRCHRVSRMPWERLKNKTFFR